MSSPADAHAAVTILPCLTTRSATGPAPSEASRSLAPQCVAAGRSSRWPVARSRRHAHAPRERAAHRRRRAEARASRDLVDRLGRALEPLTGSFDPHGLDVGGGGQPGLAAKGPREVTGTHRRARRERLDAEILL